MDSRRSTIVSLILLLAVALAMFGDLLFIGGTRVLGHPGADLSLQYFAWREFGFRELAKGNLALWNPHIFSGAPYFGGMQGALLYPPNWLFLVLPTPVAINWTVALHVFAIGAFMFFWMRQWDLSAAASFFAGTLVMFCGAFFPHVFAGHLPQLSAMTWSPLIFCSIDALFRTKRARWSLLGILAVAMQVLAGFPQYVFYTAIVAGLYAALRLIGHWRWRLAAALLSIYPGGALLAGVQLLPAIQTTRETTRGFRLPFQFASMLSLPPENLVTLVAPDFFGQMAKYWGAGICGRRRFSSVWPAWRLPSMRQFGADGQRNGARSLSFWFVFCWPLAPIHRYSIFFMRGCPVLIASAVFRSLVF
jgi:hypothetical protein